MTNTAHTQFPQDSPLNGVNRRLQQSQRLDARGRGRQDNPTPNIAPPTSPQPAPRKKDERTAPKNVQINHTHQKKTSLGKDVQLNLWVRPVVKAELERVAKREGLSVSAAGEALLEKVLQQDIYTQHSALLDTILNKAIRKHMRAFSTRLAVLLVRCVYATEQTRSITTNILDRQPGMTQQILEQIVQGSSDTAKRNITRVTPQLKTVIEEITKWLEELEMEVN